MEDKIPITNPKSQNSLPRLQSLRKAAARYITQPLVALLARTHVTPNMVTWFGFFLILIASGLAGTGHIFAAGWVVLVSGFFDIIDGALARGTNQVTRFGGALDSSLDRLSEAIILIGLMAYFLYYAGSAPVLWMAILLGFAMIFSFLVSYVRARAEGLDIECQVGIFTRTERVIILAVGLLLNAIPYILIAALVIITLFSFVTFVQRLTYVYQQTRK